MRALSSRKPRRDRLSSRGWTRARLQFGGLWMAALASPNSSLRDSLHVCSPAGHVGGGALRAVAGAVETIDHRRTLQLVVASRL
jgi:hypothetical protein